MPAGCRIKEGDFQMTCQQLKIHPKMIIIYQASGPRQKTSVARDQNWFSSSYYNGQNMLAPDPTDGKQKSIVKEKK